MTKVLFPGSFDPFTKGHENIIAKAIKIFDQVVIGVSEVSSKKPLFSIGERVAMIEDLYKDEIKVKVLSFNGLLVDFCNQHNIHVILRSIRNIQDLNTEIMMANVNRIIGNDLQTVFLAPDLDKVNISSSLAKELIKAGANLNDILSEQIIAKVM
jgi:pantetheine-phosphate adenylyltransferase